MVSIARTQILPAALKHQTLIAEAATATEAAGVDCEDTVQSLEHFTGLVTALRTSLAALDAAVAHEDADPMKHAQQIKVKVRGMADLRTAVDMLDARRRRAVAVPTVGNCCSGVRTKREARSEAKRERSEAWPGGEIFPLGHASIFSPDGIMTRL
jgi:glutamine synthetase type III